jgi:large subunit ribosomal protein L25
MVQTVVIKGQPRTVLGTSVSRRLRRSGQIPAVVYGHKEANVSFSINHDEIYKAIRQGSRLVDLEVGSKAEKALIRDVQWDHLGNDILHVDFARVGADEKIHLEVRVEIRGTAPGLTQGGNLVQPLHSLHVECLITNIPESIRVNVGELQLNQSIHVKELKLPEGVTVTNDPDAIVVQVSLAKLEAEAPATGPVAEGAAEPEIIGRKVDAEGEEEAEAK